MTKVSVIEKVTRLVRTKFGKIKSIKAIYLHGSILVDGFGACLKVNYHLDY